MMNQQIQKINDYIKAKDNHKPHLMKRVFSENAILEMKVNTDAISFPSKVVGVDNITDTLVRNFNTSYEDVYTICLDDTVVESNNKLQCRWFVGMTEVESTLFRIGYGDYHWTFEENSLDRVIHLQIVIDNMMIFPAENHETLASWFSTLPHPWASSSEIVASMPDITLLSDVRSNIKK